MFVRLLPRLVLLAALLQTFARTAAGGPPAMDGSTHARARVWRDGARTCGHSRECRVVITAYLALARVRPPSGMSTGPADEVGDWRRAEASGGERHRGRARQCSLCLRLMRCLCSGVLC